MHFIPPSAQIPLREGGASGDDSALCGPALARRPGLQQRPVCEAAAAAGETAQGEDPRPPQHAGPRLRGRLHVLRHPVQQAGGEWQGPVLNGRTGERVGVCEWGLLSGAWSL